MSVASQRGRHKEAFIMQVSANPPPYLYMEPTVIHLHVKAKLQDQIVGKVLRAIADNYTENFRAQRSQFPHALSGVVQIVCLNFYFFTAYS